ncbi:DoxX family protein [Epilithonimonas hispanica]
MLTHALPKFEKLIANDNIEFINFLGLGSAISLVLVVFAELLCSVFIIFGFITRLAAIPLMITMLGLLRFLSFMVQIPMRQKN